MKKSLFMILVLVSTALSAQEKNKQKPQIVEVSCGQCQFGMTEKKGCDLAVRLDGKSYFVEGTTIDDHGDAHADDGFCSTIKRAEVKGQIKGDQFVVRTFKLLPTEKK